MALTDIDVHENDITPLLESQQIPIAEQDKILAWYNIYAWSSSAILEAHRPFSGVLEVIRWFQMQPNTYVGLNTARPERIRDDTLHSLNRLGEAYKVNFSQDLLFMMPNDWSQSAPRAKALGVEQFRQAGFHVFAFVDNEPDNLAGVSEVDPAHEILLLHADTIFHSKRTKLPVRAVAGFEYDLTELIPQRSLPQHIHFVWDKINTHNFESISWPYLDQTVDRSLEKDDVAFERTVYQRLSYPVG